MDNCDELIFYINNFYPLIDKKGNKNFKKNKVIIDVITLKVGSSIDQSNNQWYSFINELKFSFPNSIIGDMAGYQFPSLYLYVDFPIEKEDDNFEIISSIVLIKSLLFDGYTVFFKDEYFTKKNINKNEKKFPEFAKFYFLTNNEHELDFNKNNIINKYKKVYPNDKYYSHFDLNNINVGNGPSYSHLDLYDKKIGSTAFEYLFADDYPIPIFFEK
jgi:hypothetical protein